MSVFGIIAKPLAWVLEFLYGFIGNYGICIIILTCAIKALLYPFYKKQILSTTNMSSMQPKMKEIQQKYANDKAKMNEEMSKLYKESGFNPAGGCLPMIIQMVVIMGLFALLRQPMSFLDEGMILAVHESFLWIKDLAQPDLWILPIAAAVTTFISSSIQQKNSIGQPGQGKAMMLIMKYFFPLMILWLARSYPSGLAIYWLFSQIIQIFYNLRFAKIRKDMAREKALEEARKKLKEV